MITKIMENGLMITVYLNKIITLALQAKKHFQPNINILSQKELKVHSQGYVTTRIIFIF